MSIAEAMSASLPIISTVIGGIPDQVDEGVEGFLVTPGDVDALAAKMLELAQNPLERSAMGERANSKFKQAFSPDICLPKIRSIYRNLD